ncbi:MAG: hypothetical protein JWR75_1024 [Devosia sp.]|nr:hypothetical protein [Devosia sp.]
MTLHFTQNVFPMFNPADLDDVKDPCPVFDGHLWHMFGSGGTVTTETWTLFHATTASLDGPWIEHAPVTLSISGSGIAAPGMIYEEGVFHMFVQTEFMKSGGRVEHAVSNNGFDWVLLQPAILSIPESAEHGVYDPHPAVIGGIKYLVYSAMPNFTSVPQPDVYLVRSTSGTWFGPWERLGKILDHAEVPHHNSRDHPDYEWGIEGAQLVELPDGRVLMNATCFLPTGERGSRQRVFFAIADKVDGPYRSIGPVLDQLRSGENGHSTVMIAGHQLILFYQSRVETTKNRWRFGVASFLLSDVIAA